jgi:hypothetical protein
MKVFSDVEIIERGRDLPIILASVGMITEDGTEFYAVNEECLSTVTRNVWSSITVAPHLPIHTDGNFVYEWDHNHPEHDYVMALDQIAARAQRFLLDAKDDHGLELWAYYGAYGYVALCQLFGSKAELPAGIPMWTHELNQLMEARRDYVLLPPEPENTHHAMADARWVKAAYESLINS